MKIKISESKLKQIINESVRRTLRESSEDYNRFGVWDLVEELKEYLGADDLINRICGRMDPMTLSKMLRDIKSVEIGDNDNEIVNESIRRVLKETMTQKKQRLVTESMVAPYKVERVWVSKDYDDCFIAFGDGKYFDVYPSYGDSFIIDNKSDSEIETEISSNYKEITNFIEPYIDLYAGTTGLFRKLDKIYKQIK